MLAGPSTTSRKPKLLLALLALASLTLCGCGTGVYAQKMEMRLDEMKREAPFVALFEDPTTDLPVNFRVPRIFKNSYNLVSVHQDDNHKRIKIDRVLPPWMPMVGGFQVTYESFFILPNQDKAPIYFYVWEIELPPGTPSELESIKKNKNPPEEVSVTTPKGEKITWYRSHLERDDSFHFNQGGIDVTQHTPGVWEAWYYSAPGWDLMLGWRTTDKAWAGKVDDVQVNSLPALVAGTLVLPPSRAATAKAATPPGTANTARPTK